MRSRASWIRVRRVRGTGALPAIGLLVAMLVLTACSSPQSGPPTASANVPTPQTRAARTAAARGTPSAIAHLPTAIIYVDAAGTPVWPTPPPACATTATTNLRPELGPTVGESPVWVTSAALPVVPWRNELIRTRWLIESGAPGDLIISGRRTDGDGTARFIRQGAEGVSEQLRVPSAGAPRSGRPGEEARPYVDYPVLLVLPAPGCWELTARIGENSRTMRIFVYS